MTKKLLSILMILAMLAATAAPVFLTLFEPTTASAAATGSIKLFDGTAVKDKNWATSFKDTGGRVWVVARHNQPLHQARKP